MRLPQLLRDTPFEADPGARALEIAYLSNHPGAGGEACLFVKTRRPGFPATAVAEAVERGCRAVLIDADDEALDEVRRLGALAVRVAGVNRAYAAACAAASGDAHRRLTLVGVTGTKGKTSTCHLVEAALRACGRHTGLISSLVRRTPSHSEPAGNTTPEPPELHAWLARMVQAGVTHAVIEASSIGIVEDRLHGLRFVGLGFTNLGREHHDYHGGPAAYAAAKRRLFLEPERHAPGLACAVNVDDAEGRVLARLAPGHVTTCGLRRGTLRPDAFECAERHTRVRLADAEVCTPLLGQHNVSNILVALALARDALGLPLAEAAAGLSAMTPLPGRLERLSTPGSLDVYVDAAHTPESVSAALATLAALAHGRRRAVVVGCGGGSDRGKRPHMARLAAASADHCILTSDNPRHEDPAAITAQMLAGVRAHDRARVRVLLDRRAAIEAALAWAWPDGIVALLGKGAETVQEVGGRREPHDDRQAALEWLRRREAGGGSGPGP